MFRLLRYFSLTSAVALIVFTVVLAYLYRQNAVNDLIETAESQNAALARSFANAIWPRYSDYVRGASGLDGDALRSRPETREIHRTLKRLTAELPVLKIKMYSAEGLTVYSSEPSQMGADSSGKPGFLAAINRGIPSTQLSFRDTFTAFEGTVTGRHLAESYLPIQRGDGPIQGVFELYSDVTPLVARIERTTTEIVIGLMIGFGALYALLFLIVRRADRILKEQYADRQHEIAERKQAQSKAQKTADELEILVEEQGGTLRAVLDNAIDAIISIDSNGTIDWFNRAAEKIFGYESPEIIGKNVTQLVPESLRHVHDESLTRRANGSLDAPGHVIGNTRELEGLRRDGTVFPMEISVGVSRAGGKTNYVGILRDITERKQTQDQLLHSQKLEAIGQLTGGVAHEFNNLLTAIGGFGRMALRDVSDAARIEKCVGEIVKASDQAATLTKQMLAFGHKQKSEPQAVKVSDLLVELRSMMQPLVDDNIEIRTESDDENTCAMVDPNHLKQAVLNLAINGAQAMPGGGILTVRSRIATPDRRFVARFPKAREDAYVAVSVSDSGSGIDEETLQHIFEPFFTTKEPGVGTGLGLSMVYGLVEQAGGVVDVETELDVGTTFTIFLPITEAVPESTVRATVKESRKPGEKLTILIAEDKESVRELAKLTLEELGHRILTAADGAVAAEVFRAHVGQIDLLLTDVAMPGKSGPELAAELLREQPDLKIVFMSGHTVLAGLKAEEAGPKSRFLQKPFDPDELGRLVGELLDL